LLSWIDYGELLDLELIKFCKNLDYDLFLYFEFHEQPNEYFNIKVKTCTLKGGLVMYKDELEIVLKKRGTDLARTLVIDILR